MTVEEYNHSVDRYSDGLFRFIWKNIKDREMAMDIVQESFEKLWKKVHNVSYEKVKSYLFTTAYHTMIDYIRKDRNESNIEKLSPDKYSYNNHYTDLQKILHEALDKLPEIQRSVILLRDYEGYSYREIGEITGLNEAQVKVYIYRGRVFLKNYIVSIENLI
ncbi:MAG: RNA polymerase subunit sigma-24 [Bacteroides sp. SM23_62_1]|nr:MAG: RNA polymerase subunit sigma-24 [Bacteroides sp. SM23_62_1]